MNNASAEMAEDFIDMIFVEKWAKLIKTLIDASDILLPNKEELHITDLMDDMLKPEVRKIRKSPVFHSSNHIMKFICNILYGLYDIVYITDMISDFLEIVLEHFQNAL